MISNTAAVHFLYLTLARVSWTCDPSCRLLVESGKEIFRSVRFATFDKTLGTASSCLPSPPLYSPRCVSVNTYSSRRLKIHLLLQQLPDPLIPDSHALPSPTTKVKMNFLLFVVVDAILPYKPHNAKMAFQSQKVLERDSFSQSV